MTYAEKNKDVVTSHKLRAFERCGFCFEAEFIRMLPNPFNEENDNFILGQAIDDYITFGPKYFDKNYEVVARRSKDAVGKIQLTASMHKKIINAIREFEANGLFYKKYKKKNIVINFGNLKLSGELDHFDKKNNLIIDLKTCANIETFDKSIWEYGYTFQLMFYQFLVEEATGKRCKARLEVVDKGTHFSRSRCYEFSAETLFAERSMHGGFGERLARYKAAHDTGMFLPCNDPDELEKCPYYGTENHGRRKTIIHM